MTGMTEAELLVCIRPRELRRRSPGDSSAAGDALQRAERALEELLSRQYAWVSRMCFFEIRDQNTALDCIQDTMFEIAKSIQQFDGRSEFRTWAFAITKRVILRHRKKDRTRQERFPLGALDDVSRREADGGEVKPTTEALLIVSESQRKLLRVVRELPEQQRFAVLCHYFEDLSVEETAGRIGCSVGTVKTHLFRARERLKEILAENDDPEE